MASNLQIDAELDLTPRPVTDQAGVGCPLALSTDQVVISNPGDGNVLLTLGSERAWVFKQLGSGAGTALELTAANPNNNNKNFIINTDGRVGIGTPTPSAKLHVEDGHLAISNPGDGNVLLTLGSERSWVFKQLGSGAGTALELTAANPNNNNKNFIINTDGRVGIGTPTPEAKLHVEGSIQVSDDIVLTGADCAEEFDIVPGSDIARGTVMVIGEGHRLRHSDHAYDRRAAGIIAGAGPCHSGIVLGRTNTGGERVAIALNGTAYCLVDASECPIEVGDLLTTSERPGHAMRAVDRERSFGAVIGKALSGVQHGTGLIPVLVALQ